MKTDLPNSDPWRPGIGPITLILIASLQWILVSTANISPWIGGGYGMFATVDGPHRKLIASSPEGTSVIADVAIRQAPFPWSLDDVSERANADRIVILKPDFDPSDGSVSWTPLVEVDGARD